MPDDDTRQPAVAQDVAEEEEEDAADLPRREAMSLLLDPSALLGGGLVPTAPAAPGSSMTPTPPAAPTPGSDVSTPSGPVSLPHVPTPPTNPDGTYNPNASTTSST
jgi:hypothetical protein